MPRISLVELAHQALAKQLKPGDIAIDATAGNGHDTLFLAQQVGQQGQVYSFDIQASAIKNTTLKLQQANYHEAVTLIQASHHHWLAHLPEKIIGKVSAIMFNLGYLPRGDKAITTIEATTLAALKQVPKLLNSEASCLTIMAYPGHPQGLVESAAIEHWCQQLDSNKVTIEKISVENTLSLAPQLFIIRTPVPG